MAMKLKSRAAILFKLEADYGVDALPVPGTDTLICSKPEFGIIGEQKERKVVLPYMGKLASLKIGTGLELSFDVQVNGSGTAGTAPLIGRLLRCCNFAETVTPATSVEYELVSDLDGESGTAYVYQDGYLHKFLGSVGDLSKWTNATNEIVEASFKFQALYMGAAAFATEVEFPTLTYPEADVPPLLFRAADFSIHGVDAIVSSFNFQLGNKIAKRPYAGADSGVLRYFIADRAVKGDCDPEVEALATFNPWTMWEDTTPGALAATIGSVAGNILDIDMASITPAEAPKYGEREGLLTYAYGFESNPTLTAGNNELKLTFR